MGRQRWWIFILALTFALSYPSSLTLAESHEDVETFHADRDDKMHGFGKSGWAHHEMYLTLLVERYAPETAAEWSAVFAERNRLKEELKALYDAQPDRKKKEMKEEKKKRKEEAQNKDEHARMMRESFERFTEAVKSKDEAKIRAALQEQLGIMKEHNTRLASRIAELKKQ